MRFRFLPPPERVFQALTDPRQLMQWWGQKGMYHHTDWKADVRPGGAWRSEGVSDSDGSSYHVSGEYLEIDPPRVLSYTWVASWSGPLKTVVRWELEPAPEGTLVRLRHSGFAKVPAAAQGHYEGWQRVIGWMRAFVERDETVVRDPGLFRLPSRRRNIGQSRSRLVWWFELAETVERGCRRATQPSRVIE